MNRIAIFARWPEPGRVKTRLAPALTPALTCALHRAMLADALATVAASGADERLLFWSDRPAGTDLAASGVVGADASGLVIREQRGDGLGARLEAAFAKLVSAPGDRAIVSGSDCPDLDGAACARAFEALATSDVVLAPARDGGYALIGLRRPAPELFRGIEWGSEHVLEQTLARAAESGLTVARLATLEDIDTPEDLLRWIGREGDSDPATAPHTRRALVAMRLLPPGFLRAGPVARGPR